MVQIYNKNRVIQDRYCQVLKTKKVQNSLSFTPFPMNVYRCLSILTLLPQSQRPVRCRQPCRRSEPAGLRRWRR